ncbi:substrate-binding domain-containing protein [Conexibacter sp. CPCC 206217]|uniref:sugar ABC transporter substrate-binding protein n=1 Tax=Conexibacter sp. CPCC 206217 TaxID=3064574 RepID=UPI0027269455|nr:substrate-binding domain-containing protein [Conexibacter sp. CPCC 206217]MDO8213558.1 substrate-binding domain-containing protein [Conexibacter sp. CPCC 206217]
MSRRRFLATTGITAGLAASGGLLAACGSDGNADAQKTTTSDGQARGGTNNAPVGPSGKDIDLSRIRGGKTIGVVSYVSEVGTLARGIKEFHRIGPEIDWKFEVVDAAGDTTKMGAIAQDFITKKVDGLVILNGPSAALGNRLQAATDQGIPVVGIWNEPTNGIEHVIYPSDWIGMGPMLEYVLQRIDYSGDVAVLYFDDNTPGVQRRIMWEAGLGYYAPDVRIVEKVPVRVPGQIDDARQKVAAMLPKYPDLKAVLCGWDEPAMGALQAIDQSGRDDVWVTGSDGNLETLDLMRENPGFAATNGADCELMSRAAVGALDELFNGASRESLGPVTTVPSVLVTAANLPPRGQYATSTILPIYDPNA